ncbi:transcriptional regulator, LysR family [Ruegeria halocynthiae]|uniref:Transcriptional regulator, LysR family n=1 Tax=Ruegeria halocynthiae TaxID=985054 RepID=A0A1H3E3L2_9RHOB|nr:LysR family transcriptional regulator [Ruegeria halocynthiae]SDX72878.1 transcriptional regulator, LysR family [Ruegeria halocynthiae]
MHTQPLRSIVKVSQVQSFSKAADQLGLTLSALSMQMKSLEQALGVTLFDRSVRPPRLTPTGRAIVKEAIPLLKHEGKIFEICRPGDELAGQFRLGFITTAAVRLLPKFLEAATQQLAYATFEFETGLSANLQSKVLMGQLDAAVITDTDGLPSQLSARVLKQERFVFAAHKNLLNNGFQSLLHESDFFHFMPETGIGKLIAQAMLQYERPARSKTIVLDNLEAIMECVTVGLGFTLLPVPDVERYRIPELKLIDAHDSLQRKLVLVTLRESALTRHQEELSALLETYCGPSIPSGDLCDLR